MSQPITGTERETDIRQWEHTAAQLALQVQDLAHASAVPAEARNANLELRPGVLIRQGPPRSGTIDLPAQLIAKLAECAHVPVDPTSVLHAPDELRSLLSTDIEVTTAWLTECIGDVTERHASACTELAIAQRTIAALRGLPIGSRVLLGDVVRVFISMDSAAPTEFETDVSTAERVLHPFGVAVGDLARAFGKARNAHPNTVAVGEHAWLFLRDSTPFISVDCGHMIDEHNRAVWASVPNGTSYTEARTASTPHLGFLVHQHLVLHDAPKTAPQLCPELYEHLSNHDGFVGTMQKVGNDRSPTDRPKVVLLEGKGAVEDVAQVLTGYIHRTLRARRSAGLKLRKEYLPSVPSAAYPRDVRPLLSAARTKNRRAFRAFVEKRGSAEHLDYMEAVERIGGVPHSRPLRRSTTSSCSRNPTRRSTSPTRPLNRPRAGCGPRRAPIDACSTKRSRRPRR